jgi:hypothetical protein
MSCGTTAVHTTECASRATCAPVSTGAARPTQPVAVFVRRQTPRGAQLILSEQSIYDSFLEAEDRFKGALAITDDPERGRWQLSALSFARRRGKWQGRAIGELTPRPSEHAAPSVTLVDTDTATAFTAGHAGAELPNEADYPVKTFEVIVRVDPDECIDDVANDSVLAAVRGQADVDDCELEVDEIGVTRHVDGSLWAIAQVEATGNEPVYRSDRRAWGRR